MTDQEIDKWVENHASFTGNWTDNRSAKMKEDILKWAKIIAHKFYELGKEEGKKVVDYTAAFELENEYRENPMLEPKEEPNLLQGNILNPETYFNGEWKQ